MTTIRDVISYGLRQAKILSPGADPTSDEASDGLTAFQSMIDMWVANGMFGRLTDATLTEDETALEGYRYYVPAGVTLTAPTSEYESEEGDSRQPRDLALYEAYGASLPRTVKLYDRTAWVELLGLTLDSTAPLASRGLAGLSACLARTYAEMFGGELGAYTQQLARQFEGMLSRKFGTTQDKIAGEYF